MINQIAAGEVIDRPVSIVRELVDNSIDAGATSIEVQIEQGGQSFVRVSDDGCGMSAADAEMAFCRHATSKLSTIDDLSRIATLGFRGEALAAISSVSKIRMRTRSAAAAQGVELVLIPGQTALSTPSFESRGTTVEVRDLFFNQPARQKFLKSARADEQKIKSWLRQFALAHPQVRFLLRSDDREPMHMQRRESILERAKEHFGPNVFEVNHTVGPLSVRGIVLHPGFAQRENALLLFVNRRLVSDRMLVRAVKDGFQSMLKERELPAGALFIDVQPEFVDVNVHPQKSEVRFRSPQAVFQALLFAVRQALAQQPSAPGSYPTPAPNGAGEHSAHIADLRVGASGAQYGEQPGLNWNSQERVLPSPALERDLFKFSNLRYVGQALQCYLICELGQSLVIVDMHAAHERYNYNLIRNRLRQSDLTAQQLLQPVDLELDQEQAETLRANLALLNRFGLELEFTSERVIRVTAVPALLPNVDLSALFEELGVIEFSCAVERRLEELVDGVAARLACHASIRSGDMLSKEKAYALFADLDCSEFSAACPHGRPVVVSFERARVEQWFGRDR